MDPDSFVAGGGIAGLIVAVSYIGHLVLDAWREKRDASKDELAGGLLAKTTAVGDASTANAVILASLEAVHAENRQLRVDNSQFREELKAKDEKIEELTTRLQTAQEQIQNIANELEKLRTSPAG